MCFRLIGSVGVGVREVVGGRGKEREVGKERDFEPHQFSWSVLNLISMRDVAMTMEGYLNGSLVSVFAYLQAERERER